MFISKYTPLNSDLFNEVWLEKKGYFKDNIINTSIETKLKFSLKNNPNLSESVQINVNN